MQRRVTKTVAVLATVATASLGLVARAPVAAADTPGCVTRAEYRKVHKDMKKTRVHHIFDTKGHRQSIDHDNGYTVEVRSYNACPKYSFVSIGYESSPGEPMRVSAKYAVWAD